MNSGREKDMRLKTFSLNALFYVFRKINNQIHEKKNRNSDWLRAVRLIRNSAILCYHSENMCYQYKFLLSQCKFVLLQFGGEKPSREKKTNMAAKARRKLREHFVKIWSEFYFDITSKVSVN